MYNTQDKMIASAWLTRFVYVCADIAVARAAAEQFAALGLRAAVMPQKDDTLACAVRRSAENDLNRLCAFTSFITGEADVLICTASALAESYPRRADISAGALDLQKGQTHDLGALCARLVRLGYERCEQVSERGTFAVRGDILDVWSIGDADSRRIEFFGDEIEEVRVFAAAEQKARERVDGMRIYPATELYPSPENVDAVLRALSACGNASLRLQNVAASAAAQLADGGRNVRLSFLLPLCPHESFAEFFAGFPIVFDDCKSVFDSAEAHLREHVVRSNGLLAAGDTFAFCARALFDTPQVQKGKGGLLAFHRVDGQNRLFAPDSVFTVKSADLPDYSRDLTALADDIEMWARRGYAVTVCCGSAAAREKLRDLFGEVHKGYAATLTEDFLPHGGIFFSSNQVIVGTLDISKRAAKKTIKRTGRDAFVLPEVGDYVVHRVHGIGLCENICKLDMGGSERDYVVVLYAGGDKLYLPIENIDSLSKLVASEHPKLSKIGGAEFARLKEKVKQSVKDMALGLVELYARRNEAKGHAYSADDTLLDEFCADFPYTETEDQLVATADGLRDLKEGKIMDRLLCGDVGFGKTEVAMRLAFKVICEGKQVAFISPTTILARQHFETVKARMEKFGVKVVSLTRMNSRAEIRSACEALAAGKADIVCGTHRVLSSDVAFSDLGMLILDEEQRFGVADKEKIKKLKVNVNVLSLSATPIPRTLHMSMTGIRDISVLDTPPADRLPVQTFVTEYDEALCRDAIERELGRGGQVFVVYNRVADIDRFAVSVGALVPSARVCVAHGQMPEETLAGVIERFEKGEADVLVASTIIENGIDMPRANTMLVIDSDRLGLSQMYQLRGRVGRSNRLAYVYFTFDPSKILSEAAYKRLDAITQFTELSSGFGIAMRDLEIRGAGNILGKEQHGHIEKVGYDMYCKILQSAVDELRGQSAAAEKSDVTVTCDFNAFVPESYVPDKDWRVRLYARIAKLASESERAALLADLADIYGAPPLSVVNLTRVGLIKTLAAKAGASRVTIRGNAAQLTFPSVKDLPAYASSYIALGKGVSFTEKEVRVTFTGRDCVNELVGFLSQCAKK
ncbi:MAG: transcription-repair coupling factor [Clostridiales bacterium]|nr:transcription-repair coupling factor [Clostridiales bacterium]